MLNRQRENEIINILKETNDFITVKALCEKLYASDSSIRRDLKSLENRGLVKRSYGGASLVNNISLISNFNSRIKYNALEKKEIAKKAVTLINDGDIIFLDQSSTAYYLAYEIINKNSLTVVTNNIEIMMLLSNSGIKVISSGGSLSKENRNCLIGGDAQETFENIFADIMFFSVKSLSSDGLVTDCSREEILVRNSMIQNSRKRVLICDSTKFNKISPYKQCSLSDLDYLISDGDNSRYFQNFKNKIKLL